jgi:hypothetical protein
MYLTTEQVARLALECDRHNAYSTEVKPCTLRSRDVRAEFYDEQDNVIFGVTIEQDGEVDGVSLSAAKFDYPGSVPPFGSDPSGFTRV